ncbi:MAG: DEAD/DEAH box helicase [Quisquiliibacterium sp.]
MISGKQPGVSATIARVALDVPAADGFDYAIPADCPDPIDLGDWVLVPWGKGRRVGLVIELLAESSVEPHKLRDLAGRLAGAPAPDPRWFDLLRFAAGYYHRPFGEVALPAIPKLLRTPPGARSRGSAFDRARARAPCALQTAAKSVELPSLTPAQEAALGALRGTDGFSVHLLHGVTGSGKTEVYLRWLAAVLAADAKAQVLLLVPEIALTPQLIRQLQARFPGEPVAVLHSELPDGERAAHWLAVAQGAVRVVVGTRLAVLTPLPSLAAIVVDEEHDPSYKQHEGVRYSARDLAVVLAQQRNIPVVLGSATPSLESWLAARRGRYQLLSMPERVGGGALPQLELLEPRARRQRHGDPGDRSSPGRRGAGAGFSQQAWLCAGLGV